MHKFHYAARVHTVQVTQKFKFTWQNSFLIVLMIWKLQPAREKLKKGLLKYINFNFLELHKIKTSFNVP